MNTLTRRLLTAFLLPLSACTGFAGVALGVHRTPVVDVVPREPTATIRSPTERLLAAHHCWTRRAPLTAAGTQVIPGHAVVTLPGAQQPTYGGRALTSLALDHVLNGADPGLLVSGFCR